jgi:HipA-like C-terminal domain
MTRRRAYGCCQSEICTIEHAGSTCTKPANGPRTGWSIVKDCDDISALVVRRFDRTVDSSGNGRRLACEDGCQVVGRYPADKYALETAELFAAVGRECRARPVAIRTLMQQLAFETMLDDLVERAEPWLDRLDELPFDTTALRRLRRHMTAALRRLRSPGRTGE